MGRRLEEIDPLKEKLRGATPKEEEDRTVEEALLAHLDPLIEQHLITDVLRPIKTGKEAVVYCCHAHPSLDRELVTTPEPTYPSRSNGSVPLS
jgi:serine/threonine-protein kinase RIO1